MRYSRLGVLSIALLLQACSLIDDYLLGKDNTPHPEALVPLVSKVNLTERWSTVVGRANHTHTYLKLKPVIRAGVIYSADASGMVHAIDTKTGRVLWENRLNQSLVSGPTVTNQSVIVGTNASTLISMHQATGKTAWEARLSEDALSKSLPMGDLIIAKSIDGHLYAFDAANGKKQWESEHGTPNLILKASASPVQMGPLVLVGFSDGKLDAVMPSNGRLIWQRSMAYANGSSDVERLVDIDADPIVSNQTIYLASYQGYIGALSALNGQFIWNKPGSVYKNMSLDASTLYVTDSQDVVWAFDRNNGNMKWKQTTLKARGLTEPVLLGNYVMVGDKTGYIHVMSRQSGELIGRKQLSGGIDISPAVSGNTLYVLQNDGKLSALTLSG